MGGRNFKAIAEVFPGARDLSATSTSCATSARTLDRICGAAADLRSHATVPITRTGAETRQRLSFTGIQVRNAGKTIKDADSRGGNGLMPVASTYSLALWVLHGKHCGDGYGFPFDRPLLDFRATGCWNCTVACPTTSTCFER